MKHRDQMNIVIIGHVDHGKSTVIGRLLADTGSLPDGKLEAVKAYCKKNSRAFEYAYLLDALKDEQAQGITIDTARCFFKTSLRDYIIIDAPGHVEFLKNMVTGASRAEVALLVIDAKEGIQENSKRHGHIAAMLGIKQLVVLVNKMDLVDFDQTIFNSITDEFTAFLNRIDIHPVNFIPISAFQGDNIAEKSEKTSWYEGPTVLEQLDAFQGKKKNEAQAFRLPVQDVYKFTAEGDDRRIVAGTVVSGSASVGDTVRFLPSGKVSTIQSIEGFNISKRQHIETSEAVGVTLSTQVYITAGEVMVRERDVQPKVSQRFRTNLFWVGKEPLVKGKAYKLKIGTTSVSVKLLDIVTIVDAAELNIEAQKDQVDRHDVAECILETAKPIVFDPISELDQTGRFVIVDQYEISGGGIIVEEFSEELNKDIAKDSKHQSKLVLVTSGQGDHEQIISKEMEKVCEALRTQEIIQDYYII